MRGTRDGGETAAERSWAASENVHAPSESTAGDGKMSNTPDIDDGIQELDDDIIREPNTRIAREPNTKIVDEDEEADLQEPNTK